MEGTPRPPASSRVRPTSVRGLAYDTLAQAAQPYVEGAIRDYVAPAVGKGGQFLGDVVKGAIDTLQGGVERGVYDYMTKDPETGERTVVPSQRIDEYKKANFLQPGTERRGMSGDYFKPPGKHVQQSWAFNPSATDDKGRSIEAADEPLGDPRHTRFYENQRAVRNLVPDAGLEERGVSRFGGPGWLVDDPARTAKWAGRAALPAAVVGGLGVLEHFTQGEKPRSDYRVPVQPSGGYNPSVESAMASASAKYDLELLRHKHDMELQSMRNEAHTPGVQRMSRAGSSVTPGPMTPGDIAAMVNSNFMNSSTDWGLGSGSSGQSSPGASLSLLM
jgi:hypothetical protein